MLYNNLDCVQTGGAAAPPYIKAAVRTYTAAIFYASQAYDKNSSVDPLCGFHKAGL